MYPQTYPNDGGLIPLSCVNNIPVTYIMVVYIIINMYLIIFDHIRTTSRPIVFPVNNYCYSWYPRLYDFLWIPYYTIFNCSKKTYFGIFLPPKKRRKTHTNRKDSLWIQILPKPCSHHTQSYFLRSYGWIHMVSTYHCNYIYMYRITI